MLKPALLIGSAVLFVGAANAQVSQAPLTPTEAEAAWGDLEGFWGGLEGFWGDLDPFWGDLEGFWGDLDPFWGDLEGFWGDLEGFEGDSQMAWGDLEGFWGDLEGFWGDLEGFWDPASDVVWTDTQQADIEARFRAMASDAEAVFGDAVRARHGQDFGDALMTPLLARYGVDAELGGLTELSSRDRARLFLDFYDTLMDHSGRDRVDWWMGTTRWTPALAQDHGNGRRATVGVLDSLIKRGAQAGRRVRHRGGYAGMHEGGLQHGAAVASLIAAPHDGQGVMGVAPRARLLNYNPFDATATAGWQDITRGLYRLRARGAHVVNASLGVENRVLSAEWATALAISGGWSDDLIVVKAAGNSGVEAQDTFWWDPSANDALLLVGSVGPQGEISAFSNRPGEACMVSWGGCAEGDRVMDRFLVAPGEMILVDDGSGTGATMRASGTSFAAPLVTGTIALMHSRWPWLERHAAATSDIVLESARDLGAPGTDAVYGRGLLDTEAALSPLDFADLYQIKGRGRNQRRVALGGALLSEGGLRGFAKRGVLVAFEDTGDTYRDFAIPLSERTVNGRTRVSGRRRQDNQSHLFGRLDQWTRDRQGLATTQTGDVQGRGYTLSFERTERADGAMLGESVYRFDNGASLTMGQGTGLPTSLMFDRQLDAGGARLSGTAGLMGLAQGGAYAGASMTAGGLGELSFAVTRTEQDGAMMGFEDDPAFDQHDQDAYAALGTAVSLSRQAFGADLSVGYQRLAEANGVLGTQGTGALSLGRGASTDAMTAEMVLPRTMGVRLGVSATTARTRGGDQSGILRVSDDGVRSTAFAARADARGVFVRGDQVALTLSQPLTATGGALVFEGAAIADRETGERGVGVTRIEAEGAPMVAEASYRMSVFGDRAELRALAGHDTGTAESQLGMSLGLPF